MPRSKIYVSDLYHQRQLWYSSIRAVDDSIDGRMPRPSRRRLHLPRLAGSQIHDASQRLHHEPSRANEEIVANQIHPPIRLPPPRRRRRPRGGGEMMMLIDCSGCRTPLQLPHGAPCIRCAICGAVTYVAAAAPPPAHGDPARGAAGPGRWRPSTRRRGGGRLPRPRTGGSAP